VVSVTAARPLSSSRANAIHRNLAAMSPHTILADQEGSPR
jgi:hypothetical protein